MTLSLVQFRRRDVSPLETRCENLLDNLEPIKRQTCGGRAFTAHTR